MLETLAVRTGTPLGRVKETTLTDFASQSSLLISALMPLRQAPRKRRRHSLQFCPSCLVERRYFRRTWRLAFVTVCPRHGTYLADRCFACSRPVIIRSALKLTPTKSSIDTRCHACAYSYERAITFLAPSILVSFTARVLRAATPPSGTEHLEKVVAMSAERFLIRHHFTERSLRVRAQLLLDVLISSGGRSGRAASSSDGLCS
jgi:hypothetical protein